MNYIDLLFLLFILGYSLLGYFRGAIRVGLDFLFMIFSIVLAFLFNNNLASFFSSFIHIPPNLLKVISFLLILLASEAIFSFLAEIFIKKIPKDIKKSKWNRYLGVLPGSLRGTFFFALILLFSISLPLPPEIKEKMEESFFGRPLISYTSEFEQQLGSIFNDAAQEAFTLLTIRPDSTESIKLGFKTSEYSVDYKTEREMLDMVNKERSKRGLKILVWDEEIARVARLHSADMFERGYFAHENLDGLSPFDRMDNGGIVYKFAGENLALAPTVETAHKGLMNSTGHRENILRSEFGRLGVGVMDGGIYGKMFTQNFAD